MNFACGYCAEHGKYQLLETLLTSHKPTYYRWNNYTCAVAEKGYLEIFPAVPQSWKDIFFTKLRAEGAFLVSAKKENGTIEEIIIKAAIAGEMKLKLPFKTFFIAGSKSRIRYLVTY